MGFGTTSPKICTREGSISYTINHHFLLEGHIKSQNITVNRQSAEKWGGFTAFMKEICILCPKA